MHYWHGTKIAKQKNVSQENIAIRILRLCAEHAFVLSRCPSHTYILYRVGCNIISIRATDHSKILIHCTIHECSTVRLRFYNLTLLLEHKLRWRERRSINIYSWTTKHQCKAHCGTNQTSSRLKGKCGFQRVRLIPIMTSVSSTENP